MTELIAIDIETTSTGKILGIGVYKPGKYMWYTLDNLPSNLTDYVQTYHGGSFDIIYGIKNGITCFRHDHDTLIMSSLLPYEKHDLESLAIKELHMKSWKKMLNIKKLEDEPIATVIAYNKLDCRATYELHVKLARRLQSLGLWNYYKNYSMNLRRELNTLEQQGIKLDMTKLTEIRSQYANTREDKEKYIKETYKAGIRYIQTRLLQKVCSKVKTQAAKNNRRQDPAKYNALFNLQSSQHVLKLLGFYDVYPTKFDKKAMQVKPSTSTEALSKLDTPLVTAYREWRKANKMLQFFNSWEDKQVDGILTPRYNQHTVVTGRLSSSNPNIQQVPVRDNPEIRELFIPHNPNNVFIVADYGQLELRLAGYFSQDEKLIDVIKSGKDFHGKIACDVFNLTCDPDECKEMYHTERAISKTIVYLTIYGGSAEALQSKLSIEGYDYTLPECKAFLKAFSKAYPGLKGYTYLIGSHSEKQGYCKTLFGRKIYFKKGEAMHFALNYQLQGSGTELTTFALIGLGPVVRAFGGSIISTIHDEVIVECPKDKVEQVKNAIQHNMVSKVNLTVPLEVSVTVGNSWGCKE